MIAAGKVFAPSVPVPCAQVEPEAFFHPDGERGDQRMDRQIRAARICALCPVASACLRWSLDNRVEYGIWGGVGEQDRRRMWRNERNRAPTPAGGHRRDDGLCARGVHDIAVTGRQQRGKAGSVIRICSACRRETAARRPARRRVRQATCARGHAMTDANVLRVPGYARRRCRACWDAGNYPFQQSKAV